MYQHPQYSENRQRFRPGFDYYSLGLVLLEISLLQTLNDLMPKLGAGTSPSEETSEKLLAKRVPLLNHALWNGYSKATRVCMTWIGNDHDHPDRDNSTATEDLTQKVKAASLLAFKEMVVEPLRKCSV